MKTILTAATLLFAVGCSAPQTSAKAPVEPAKTAAKSTATSSTAAAKKSSSAKTSVHPQQARLQSNPYAAPGQMDVSWTPTQRRVVKHRKPKTMAKPYFTSNKNMRGRLFVTPTKREN